jgi:hypothetical protein
MHIHSTQTPRSSYMPYPELVEEGPHDGPWKVEDSNENQWLPSNGATNKPKKTIYVPFDDGGEGVTLHELAHVRWSPERFPRVRFPLICLQAVEDARINLGLQEAGMPFVLDREQLAHVAHLAAQDVKERSLVTVIIRAIASLGTSAAPVMMDEIEALAPRAADIAVYWVRRTEERLSSAQTRVEGPVAPFRVAHQIAKDLARDLTRRGLMPEGLKIQGLGCCQVVGKEGEEHGCGAKKRLSAYERMLERERRRSRGKSVSSGRMRIVRPPLTERQPSVLRGGISASRCRAEGTRMSRPDRLVIDRAIFARSGTCGTGTVLIDTSGSMSLSVEAVEGIVRAAGGAAVVATYSGSGDEGELRIVASGDRRAANDHFESFGTGNIIDLPALEGLAKQSRPRLWVSDGCVTGVSDRGCEILLEECREVISRCDSQRVDNTEEALEALA